MICKLLRQGVKESLSRIGGVVELLDVRLFGVGATVLLVINNRVSGVSRELFQFLLQIAISLSQTVNVSREIGDFLVLRSDVRLNRVELCRGKRNLVVVSFQRVASESLANVRIPVGGINLS